jgi:hypothetical protein
MRKLGNGTTLEPKALAQDHRIGRQVTAACPRGVLSGRVLSGGESPLHGEGPDGSTPPAKETRAGHVGLDNHEPTSLRGIATRAKIILHDAKASTTEEPDARILHVRVCAGGAG